MYNRHFETIDNILNRIYQPHPDDYDEMLADMVDSLIADEFDSYEAAYNFVLGWIIEKERN